MNVNRTELYSPNSLHHLHPYPGKVPTSARHHLPHTPRSAHHHSTINLTEDLLYHSGKHQQFDVLSNDTEPDSNIPLNRFHRNASSLLYSNSLSTSAFLLPTTSTTISSLIRNSTRAAIRQGDNRSDSTDWPLNQLHSLNRSLVTVIQATPLQPPITVPSTDQVVFSPDQAEVYVASDPEGASSHWATSNDIPILIGAAAGQLKPNSCLPSKTSNCLFCCL